MIVALARSPGGRRLAVVGSASASISNESWLASLTSISFSIVLAIEAVTIFLEIYKFMRILCHQKIVHFSI
jgi:hypothetical protein